MKCEIDTDEGKRVYNVLEPKTKHQEKYLREIERVTKSEDSESVFEFLKYRDELLKELVLEIKNGMYPIEDVPVAHKTKLSKVIENQMKVFETEETKK